MSVLMARPARTIMEVCLARGGMLKGSRVCAFIGQWAIASEALGKPITLEEYADWWRESRSTSYRHQARFREVFPGMDTPQPFANLAIARSSEWRSRGIKGLGELPASVLTA